MQPLFAMARSFAEAISCDVAIIVVAFTRCGRLVRL
jgi:hypothetical protein